METGLDSINESTLRSGLGKQFDIIGITEQERS